MTTTVITHPSVASAAAQTILGIILQNLEADTPAIIALSPTTKTATILLASELSIATMLTIWQSLDAVQSATA